MVSARYVTVDRRRRRSTKLLQHPPSQSTKSPTGGLKEGGDHIPWPTTTPQISSFGTVPCNTKLNAISTHGKYGAVNTSSPKKLSLVSGFRLLQMYTRLLLSAEPRNGIDSRGERTSKIEVA